MKCACSRNSQLLTVADLIQISELHQKKYGRFGDQKQIFRTNGCEEKKQVKIWRTLYLVDRLLQHRPGSSLAVVMETKLKCRLWYTATPTAGDFLFSFSVLPL
jgi:hypothetical protein